MLSLYYHFFVGHLPGFEPEAVLAMGGSLQPQTLVLLSLHAEEQSRPAGCSLWPRRLPPSQRERRRPPSWPGVPEPASRPEPDQFRTLQRQ